MSTDTRSASFVVRLRIDRGAQGPWWGEVQHVETGERVAFRDHEKLVAFLRRHLNRMRTAAGGPGESAPGR